MLDTYKKFGKSGNVLRNFEYLKSCVRFRRCKHLAIFAIFSNINNFINIWKLYQFADTVHVEISLSKEIIFIIKIFVKSGNLFEYVNLLKFTRFGYFVKLVNLWGAYLVNFEMLWNLEILKNFIQSGNFSTVKIKYNLENFNSFIEIWYSREDFSKFLKIKKKIKKF